MCLFSKCVNCICLVLIKLDCIACWMVAAALLEGTLYLFAVYCQMFTSFMISRSLSVIDALRHKAAGRDNTTTDWVQTQEKVNGMFRHRALCLALACATCCMYALCVGSSPLAVPPPPVSPLLLLLHPAGHPLTPPITPWSCQRFPPVKREFL